MTLKARLTTLLGEVGLDGPTPTETAFNHKEGVESFWYDKIHAENETSLEDLNSYTTLEKPSGVLRLIRTVFPEEGIENSIQSKLFSQLLADERLDNFTQEKALFLDIEATHVFHGAACQAFIIGLGFFDPQEGLVIEQILQTNPEDELPGLEHLLERIEQYPYLVTYNGKSYDLTVLENRLVIQRLMTRKEASIKLNPHIDLLHVCRRIWAGCFEDCKLGTMEHRVLSIPRSHDLPGRFAPDFYFNYLHSQNARYLEPVLEHNLLDVRNLARLLQKSDETLSFPPLLHTPRIRANIGRWFLNRGLEDGLEALLSCLNAPLEPKTRVSLFRACLRRLKQNHDIPGIESVLTRFRTAFPDEAEPFIELAKLHEHRYKNLTNALYFAHEAAKRVRPYESELRRDIIRRIRRLNKRLGSSNAQKGSKSREATG